MYVYGKAEFIVFLKLIKLLVKKTEKKKSFINFNTDDFGELAEDIAEHFKLRSYPIAPNTLRDYSYICDSKRKKKFRVREDKLDILCKYVNNETWSVFVSTRIKAPTEKLDNSFYQSNNIFLLIDSKKSEMQNIIKFWEGELQQDPSSNESRFNIGVCLLYAKHFNRARLFFEKCIEIESQNKLFYLFKSLSLLNGERPYRHKKNDMDNILVVLQHAMQLDPKNSFIVDLLHLIQRDFYLRIGYNIVEEPPLKAPQKPAWLIFLSQCSGISIQELKIILL